jgi:YD repeat-containing protein
MVALLRQSGYTASYVYGQIELSPAQLTAWLGVGLGDGCAVVDVLQTGGGIPVTLNVMGSGCGAPLISADIAHVWVSVTGGSLGSNTYVYDPSFKGYTAPSAGINLASAMGYNQTALIAAAMDGTTVSANRLQDINRSSVRTLLNSYANNLIGYIRGNLPTATLNDVVGGKYIQPITQPYIPQTSLSYEKPGDVPQVWTGDIPSQYKTTIEIKIGGIDQTYFVDQIYGHRLTIVYDSSSRPVLNLDGSPQDTGSANASTITFNVDLPFCWATSGASSPACPTGETNIFTATVNTQATSGNIHAIVDGSDYTGRGSVEFHRQQLQANQAGGAALSSEAVLGEALNMIGYAWAAQSSRAADLEDRIVGSKIVTHCYIAVVGQVGGLPAINLRGCGMGASSLNSSDMNRAVTSYFGSFMHGTAFEHGTLDQTFLRNNVGAVSGIRLFDIAATPQLSQPNVFYDASSANWTSVKAALVGYTAAQKSTIESTFINNGYRVVLPLVGDLMQGFWVGAGWFAISGDQTNLSYFASGVIQGKGGSGDTPMSSDDLSAQANETAPEPYANQQLTVAYFGFAGSGSTEGTYSTYSGSFDPGAAAAAYSGGLVTKAVSSEPIDLSSGAYLYDHDDISVGTAGFPLGLNFHRSYTSLNRYNAGSLGLGWSHGYAISASLNSDGLKGLGQDSPIDGAAAIVGLYIIQDLLSDATKPLNKMVIAALIDDWFMDQLTNNTVNIASGSQGEQFMLLPDGTYNAQLGSTDRLSLAYGAYTLKYKDATALAFNQAGNISTWQTPGGPTVTFAYDSFSPPRLTGVTNGLGRALALSYNASNQVTAVTDNSSPPRSVSYGYDFAGNLISYTDPTGNTTTFSYNPTAGGFTPGQLTQIFPASRPQGPPIVTNTYDTLGRVMSQANGNNQAGNNTTWNYFFAGYRSEEDDAYGTRHVIYLDPRGNVNFNIGDLAGLNRVTATLYDGLGRPTQVTFPEGGSTMYAYDGSTNPWANNVASITRVAKPGAPLANTTQSFTYDPTSNKVATSTDALGRVSTYSYDQNGNLTLIARDVGASPHLNARGRFTYDGYGRVLTAVDSVGTTTQFNHDVNENLISVVADYGRLNLTTSYTYYSSGDVASLTDPKGNTSRMTYDAARRLLTATAPIAPNFVRATNVYDPDGRVTSVTRTNGATNQVVRSSYTNTGKVASTIDANGNTITRSYDLDDRLASVTDPTGGVTSYAYDPLSRRSSVSNIAIQATPLVGVSYTPDGLIATLRISSPPRQFYRLYLRWVRSPCLHLLLLVREQYEEPLRRCRQCNVRYYT